MLETVTDKKQLTLKKERESIKKYPGDVVFPGHFLKRLCRKGKNLIF